MASLARPVTSRAVHLRITPRPSNLGESREILRLISEFGEVEYFKNLKYDTLSAPNTALVIFKDQEAAMHCMKRSPIRFRMGRAIAPVEEEDLEESAPVATQAAAAAQQHAVQVPAASNERVGGAWGLGQTRSMSTNSKHDSAGYTPMGGTPARPVQQPFQPPPLSVLDDSRIFQIQTNPARAHFRDQINMGHYHGNFAIDTKRVPQTELEEVVPLLGLSCVNWKAKDKAWTLIRKEKERERAGVGRRRSLKELYESSWGTEGFRDEALPR